MAHCYRATLAYRRPTGAVPMKSTAVTLGTKMPLPNGISQPVPRRAQTFHLKMATGDGCGGRSICCSPGGNDLKKVQGYRLALQDLMNFKSSNGCSYDCFGAYQKCPHSESLQRRTWCDPAHGCRSVENTTGARCFCDRARASTSPSFQGASNMQIVKTCCMAIAARWLFG